MEPIWKNSKQLASPRLNRSLIKNNNINHQPPHTNASHIIPVLLNGKGLLEPASLSLPRPIRLGGLFGPSFKQDPRRQTREKSQSPQRSQTQAAFFQTGQSLFRQCGLFQICQSSSSDPAGPASRVWREPSRGIINNNKLQLVRKEPRSSRPGGVK